MASEGDSISPELRFLEEFSKVGDTVDTEDDSIQYRTSGCFVNENDFDGEVTDWALQYLYSHKCPYALAAAVARLTCEELKQADLNNYIFQENGDSHSHSILDSKKLQQAVHRKVHEICEQWREKPILTPQKRNSYVVSDCAVRNGRRKMEDRHVIIPDVNLFFGLENKSPQGFFAVFDGHAGAEAAIYGSAHLHHNIIRHPSYETDVQLAIREGFKKTDEHFIEKSKRENLKCGSTAVCAIVQESKLHIAWLGDSQAFLLRQGVVAEVGKPHKPSRDDERERIENLGGCVVFYGMWRVNGTLAISRAIGDVEYKPYVCSDPDIITLPRNGSEDFLVMACDGLWDVTSPEDAAFTIYSCITNAPDDISGVAEKLVQTAVSRKSSDNISVIVVFLRDPKDIAKDGVPDCLPASNEMVIPITPKLPEGTVTNGESPTKISNLWLSNASEMRYENNGVQHLSENPFLSSVENNVTQSDSRNEQVTEYFLAQSEEQSKFHFESETVVTTSMSSSTGSMSLLSFDSKPTTTTPSSDEIYSPSAVGEKIPISFGAALFQATDVPSEVSELEKLMNANNPNSDAVSSPQSDASKVLECVTTCFESEQSVTTSKDFNINVVASKSSLSPCAPEFIPQGYVPESQSKPSTNPFDSFCPMQKLTDATPITPEESAPTDFKVEASSDIPSGEADLFDVKPLTPTSPAEVKSPVESPTEISSNDAQKTEDLFQLDIEKKVESLSLAETSPDQENLLNLLGSNQMSESVQDDLVNLDVRTPGDGIELDLLCQKSILQRPESMPVEPIVVEAIPESAPVAEDVVDDESEEGEEWRYYKELPSGKTENIENEQQGLTPDNPVGNAPTVPVSPTYSYEGEVGVEKENADWVKTKEVAVVSPVDVIPSATQVFTSSPLPTSAQSPFTNVDLLGDFESKLKVEPDRDLSTEQFDASGELSVDITNQSFPYEFVTQRGESRNSDHLTEISMDSNSISGMCSNEPSANVSSIEQTASVESEAKKVTPSEEVASAPIKEVESATPVKEKRPVKEVKPMTKAVAADKSPTKAKAPVGTAKPKTAAPAPSKTLNKAPAKTAAPAAAKVAEKKPTPRTATAPKASTTANTTLTSTTARVQSAKTTTASTLNRTAAAKPKLPTDAKKPTEAKATAKPSTATASKSATTVTASSSATLVKKSASATATTKTLPPARPTTLTKDVKKTGTVTRTASARTTATAPTKDSKETANKQISSTVKMMSTSSDAGVTSTTTMSKRLSTTKTANDSSSARTTTTTTVTRTATRTTTRTTAPATKEPAKKPPGTSTSTASKTTTTARKPASASTDTSKTANQRSAASKRPTTVPKAKGGAANKVAAAKAPTIPTSPNAIDTSRGLEEEAKEKGILDAKGKELLLGISSSPPPPNVGFGDSATNYPQLVPDVESPSEAPGTPSGSGDPPLV